TTAPVATSGGNVALTAASGITLGNTLTTGGGSLTLSADSDADGVGTLTLLPGTAASWINQRQLTAAGGLANDQFGFALALSSDGNTAILGAPADDVGANTDQGSAYVFTRNTNGAWTQQQQLTATGGSANDQFGFAVTLSSDGNTAVVGTFGGKVGSNAHQG